MNSPEIYICGSRGRIGSKLKSLLKRKYKLTELSLSEMQISLENVELCREKINSNLIKMNIKYTENRSLLFVHRFRDLETNPEMACAIEMCVMRTISNFLIGLSGMLNIVVVGSCTGRLYDQNSAESYHYVKSLQKSFVNYYGLANKNVFANTIELFDFDKYENNSQSNDYKEYIKKAKLRNSGRRVPSYDDLYSIIDYLCSNNTAINCQTVKLDNGALSVQG